MGVQFRVGSDQDRLRPPRYKVGSLRTLASGTILDFKIPISAAGRYFLAGRCLAGLKNRFPNSVHIFLGDTHVF